MKLFLLAALGASVDAFGYLPDISSETICASTTICSTVTGYCLRGLHGGADLFTDSSQDEFLWQIDSTGTGYSMKVVGTDDTFFGIDGHDEQSDCSRNMFTGDRDQWDQ